MLLPAYSAAARHARDEVPHYATPALRRAAAAALCRLNRYAAARACLIHEIAASCSAARCFDLPYAALCLRSRYAACSMRVEHALPFAEAATRDFARLSCHAAARLHAAAARYACRQMVMQRLAAIRLQCQAMAFTPLCHEAP